jgi:hypothetical protein
MMKNFDELEQLYERYNYKRMNKQQLYELIKLLLNDRNIFEHFFMYEVTGDVLGKK